MNLKDWIRNAFLETSTRNKSIIYSLYDEACNYFDKKINIESYNRAVRKVYNELFDIVSSTTTNERVEDMFDMGNVLVVGDLHEPFIHPKYLSFCKQQYKLFNCDTVVFIGDIIDSHAISYHEHDPDGMSPKDELDTAIKKLKKWYKLFPKAYVCYGNHDNLLARKTKSAGLPSKLFKTFKEIIEAPKGWTFNYSFQMDGVKYMHGTGGGGQNAHITRALKNRQSTVLGHFHSCLGVRYMASHKDLIFGMQVGCGINVNSYAMEYNKDFIDRPILGCGIVFGGKSATTVPMDL